ncbi:MAG: hypothetical protein AAGB26_02455 [Planctomycetota bacterium]
MSLADQAEPAAKVNGDLLRDEPFKPLEITLDHFALIPPSPHFDRRWALPPDPTIIPFSGWHFFSEDGQAEPWRKRSGPYRRTWVIRSGGQAEQRLHEKDRYRVVTYWRFPKASRAHRPHIRIESQAKNHFAGFTFYHVEDDVDEQENYSLQIFAINDMETVVDHAPISIKYLQGDWQTVAKFDFETELPIGNKHFKILYLGEPRDDSPAVKSAREWDLNEANGWGQAKAPKPITLECQHTVAYSRDAWDYRIACFDKQGKEIPNRFNYSYSREDDRFRLSRAPIDEVGHYTIKRLPVLKQELGDFELGPIINLLPEEMVQQRVLVTPIDRFGEPATLELEPFGPGRACLVDLDSSKSIKLPDPAPEGSALIRFYDAHGVDLLLHRDEDQDGAPLMLRTIACPAYSIDEDNWERTPNECIEAVRSQYPKYAGPTQSVALKCDWRLEEDRYKPQLVTTSDGSLTLFREVGGRGDDQEPTDTITIQVRKMVTPERP